MLRERHSRLGILQGGVEPRERFGRMLGSDRMRIRKSNPAAWLAGGYLLVTLGVVASLMRDGYIGHGNGVVILLATALTSPLSLILLLLNDLLSDVNAFYLTGWPYYLTLSELGAGALLNGGLIYVVVVFIQRRWAHTVAPPPTD